LVHQVVYHPAQAMHILGSDFNDVLPEQNRVDQDAIDGYKAVLSMKLDGLPAVSASLTSSGKLKITDGHHRFCAAMAEGAPVRIEVDEQFDIEFRADWSSVGIVSSDSSVKTG